MLNVIVTNRDTALINSIGKVFPTSNAILCLYHITKDIRSRLKPAICTKQIKGEDGKIVKLGVVLEKIMDAWMQRRQVRIVRSVDVNLGRLTVFHMLVSF